LRLPQRGDERGVASAAAAAGLRRPLIQRRRWQRCWVRPITREGRAGVAAESPSTCASVGAILASAALLVSVLRIASGFTGRVAGENSPGGGRSTLRCRGRRSGVFQRAAWHQWKCHACTRYSWI